MQPSAQQSKGQKVTGQKYWTKKGYEVAENERDCVHVVTSTYTLQRVDHEKKVTKTTHKLDPKMWLLVRKEWGKQGIKYEEMLHCPEGTPKGFEIPKKKEVKK